MVKTATKVCGKHDQAVRVSGRVLLQTPPGSLSEPRFQSIGRLVWMPHRGRQWQP